MKKYPSIRSVKMATDDQILEFWRSFPHTPETKEQKLVYRMTYFRLKKIIGK